MPDDVLVVVHEGRRFTITVDREEERLAFWRVSTPGYSDYLGPRAIGNERPAFFTELVKAAWHEMARPATDSDRTP